MNLPPLPDSYEGDGYDFIGRLTGGWYPVGVWGEKGWDLGAWPHQMVLHYDGGVFGYCSFTEGDLDVKEFKTREERDAETDKYFCWHNKFHNVKHAPRSIHSHHLGPYKGI